LRQNKLYDIRKVPAISLWPWIVTGLQDMSEMAGELL